MSEEEQLRLALQISSKEMGIKSSTNNPILPFPGNSRQTTVPMSQTYGSKNVYNDKCSQNPGHSR